jgi:hypothetical protein
MPLPVEPAGSTTFVSTFSTGINAGQPLATDTSFEHGNHWGNRYLDHVFFKFEIIDPGSYEIRIQPVDPVRFEVLINDAGSTAFYVGGMPVNSPLVVARNFTKNVYVAAVAAKDFLNFQVASGKFRIQLRKVP